MDSKAGMGSVPLGNGHPFFAAWCIGHEGGAADPTTCQGLINRMINLLREAEIIGIDDQTTTTYRQGNGPDRC
jgi:hypothetical protein